MKALTTEIATEGKPLEARQVASLYLKNTLNAKSAGDQAKFHERWKKLDPAVRTAAKDALMATLNSPDASVPRFAAIAASEIACVELPYGEWANFVDAMTQCITSGTEVVALACLECLGNVCERIAEVQDMIPEVPDIPDQTVNQLLSAIVKGVEAGRSDNQRFASLTALNKSLSFVHNNMEVQQERDFIMSAFCGATQAQDPRVRRLAFACLDSVADLYYERLPDYMKNIYELTLGAIQKDPDEQVKMASMEFWCTIAKIELAMLGEEEKCRAQGRPIEGARCTRYVEAAAQAMVPLFLHSLSQHSDEYDEETYDLRQAGSQALAAFNETAFESVIPLVIPFVQENISKPDWRLKDASIVAFFSVLIGPPTTHLSVYIREIIPVILQCFNDQSEIVRDSAVFCIATILEAHMQAVSGDQAILVIQALMTKLDEQPKVASTACTALFHLCIAIKGTTDTSSTNILSGFMQPMMAKFLACMDRVDGDENNLRTAAITAASELIGAASNDVKDVLKHLLPAIVTRIGQALQMECHSSQDNKRREDILAFLIGLITSLYQKLEGPEVLGQTDAVMQLILQVLQMKSYSCHEEAFFAIGAISGTIEDKFEKYLSSVMPYVQNALQQIDSQSLCKSAIVVVSDICASVSSAFMPHCDEVMRALGNCLRDEKADRDLKPAVFSCFGDIAMAIGAGFKSYVEFVCIFLMQASQVQPPSDDEDMLDFINRLRLSILEAYMGVVVGLSDGKMSIAFAPYIDNVLKFLEYLARPESLRDSLCLEKAVELLGEIIHSLGPLDPQQMKQKVQLPFVRQLMQDAYNTQSPSAHDVVRWCQGLVEGITA